jgi:hypothetical protein
MGALKMAVVEGKPVLLLISHLPDQFVAILSLQPVSIWAAYVAIAFYFCMPLDQFQFSNTGHFLHL